ncbi:hypothetical protein ACROYT_G014047 [Oculina patagonica]
MAERKEKEKQEVERRERECLEVARRKETEKAVKNKEKELAKREKEQREAERKEREREEWRDFLLENDQQEKAITHEDLELSKSQQKSCFITAPPNPVLPAGFLDQVVARVITEVTRKLQPLLSGAHAQPSDVSLQTESSLPPCSNTVNDAPAPVQPTVTASVSHGQTEIPVVGNPV